MPLQGWARAGEALGEADDLVFRFCEVSLDKARELLRLGSLDHLGQYFNQLLLGVQQVAHLVDKELANGIGLGRFGSNFRRSAHVARLLEGGPVHDLPRAALVRRPLVSISPMSPSPVESLKY